MDRVRLLGAMPGFWLMSNSAFVVSAAGEGGWDESVDAGVMSNVRRGVGRNICGISMVEAQADPSEVLKV